MVNDINRKNNTERATTRPNLSFFFLLSTGEQDHICISKSALEAALTTGFLHIIRRGLRPVGFTYVSADATSSTLSSNDTLACHAGSSTYLLLLKVKGERGNRKEEGIFRADYLFTSLTSSHFCRKCRPHIMPEKAQGLVQYA